MKNALRMLSYLFSLLYRFFLFAHCLSGKILIYESIYLTIKIVPIYPYIPVQYTYCFPKTQLRTERKSIIGLLPSVA